MELKAYQDKYKDSELIPGWEAISNKLEEIYQKQEPKHYNPEVPFITGGNDPLDGVSVYNSKNQEEHQHFISYGFTELYYNEKAFGKEYSKFGFELSFRLKPFADDKDDPVWVIHLMQNLARYVFETGNYFKHLDVIPTNSPIRLDCDTKLVGLLMLNDPDLGTIDSPHGKIEFIQMVGITENELESLRKKDISIEDFAKQMQEKNPLLITDLNRK